MPPNLVMNNGQCQRESSQNKPSSCPFQHAWQGDVAKGEVQVLPTPPQKPAPEVRTQVLHLLEHIAQGVPKFVSNELLGQVHLLAQLASGCSNLQGPVQDLVPKVFKAAHPLSHLEPRIKCVAAEDGGL